MSRTDDIMQDKINFYKKKALEHGFTKEEVNWVEDGVKSTYRESRHPLSLRLIDIIWAWHNLLLISKINNKEK